MSGNLDALLKELLQKNPSLMKKAQEMLGVTSEAAKPREPVRRKIKQTRPDFRLLTLSGCETCHTINTSTMEMVWDDESGLFRLSKFITNRNLEVEVQYITTITCGACSSVLSTLEKEDLVKLAILFQDPTETEARVLNFKKVLKARTAELRGTSPEVRSTENNN